MGEPHNTNQMRVVFRDKDTLQVFRLGTTSNDKIEADKKRKIVQTYTFSQRQMQSILDDEKGDEELLQQGRLELLGLSLQQLWDVLHAQVQSVCRVQEYVEVNHQGV